MSEPTQSAEDVRWECCDGLASAHGRGGHCPKPEVANDVPAMKLIRWIVKCPWCDFVSTERPEATFARMELRDHLAVHGFVHSDGDQRG